MCCRGRVWRRRLDTGCRRLELRRGCGAGPYHAGSMCLREEDVVVDRSMQRWY